MKTLTALLLALPLIGAQHASGHLTYPATRDFGIVSQTTPQPITITGQSTKNFGWADGTDADWARQDDQRYFKLTLESTTTFTLTVTSLAATPFFPAFSIYSGLGHAATDSAHPDSDGGFYTANYLSSLSGPARNGAFDALHTFQIGNEDTPANGAIPAYTGGLITLTYVGHKADGTAANYGSADGIDGDGLADGTVSGTFTLPAGAYTIAIGGASYFSPDDELLAANQAARGFTATVTVPEPSHALLVAGGLLVCASLRRRGERGFLLQ